MENIQSSTKSSISEIKNLINSIKDVINLKDLEGLKVSVNGKNGLLTKCFSSLSSLSVEEKKQVAKELNVLKKDFESSFLEQKNLLEQKKLEELLRKDRIDASLFKPNKISYAHPIYKMRDIIIDYFTSLNFSLEDGPFVEDDFHNFEALNLPKFHPARDMQDTFYFKDSKLLRTHTSPVQVRVMENTKPPLRIICAGATFRRDYDITHSPMFHQVEGLLVEKGDHISFANLKHLLEEFLRFLFGDIKLRFRSSFFPFTEPSAEVDISCIFCKGSGCKVCKNTGFLEVLGCGVVDDHVFKAIGLEGVSGYAFGMGIERLAMLKWGINDLRSFYESDLKMLSQF